MVHLVIKKKERINMKKKVKSNLKGNVELRARIRRVDGTWDDLGVIATSKESFLEKIKNKIKKIIKK